MTLGKDTTGTVDVLRALTPRGWTLVAVGAAVGVGALLLAERDLLRVAVLVVSLPLASLVLLAVSAPRRVTHTRTLSAARLPVGTECQATVTLSYSDNRWPLPAGPVLVEDRLPPALGASPRFTLGLLRPGEQRTLSYLLAAQVRGRHSIGPLVVGVTDPLGCARLTRTLDPQTPLLVFPRTVDLPAVPLPGTALVDGQRPRPVPTGPEAGTMPRPYRPGDDVRRVHWRSTARRGHLMVRGEEQPYRDRSTLLVDLRAAAHTVLPTASSLEETVALAASIAVHLVDRGHQLRLLGVAAAAASPAHRDAVLDLFALAQPVPEPSLLAEITRLSRSPAEGRGVLVAVVGALTSDEVAALAACAADRTRPRIAVLAPQAAWTDQERDRAAGRLADAGWRVLCPHRLDDLPDLWRSSGEAR